MNKRMVAIGYTRFGDPSEQLQVIQHLDQLQHTKYPRIRVVSTSVNPVDYKIVQGEQKRFMKRTFPKVFGTDFFGYYEADSHSQPKPVIGMSNPLSYGACRTYLNPKKTTYSILKEDQLEACSLPAAGITALYTCSKKDRNQLFQLTENLKIDKNQKKKVLILGSNGGVGTYGVQLFHLLGYEVSISCSDKWHGFMEKLGANYCYDRGVLPQDQQFDVIIDCPGILKPMDIQSLILKKSEKKTVYIPVSIPNSQIFNRVKEKFFYSKQFSTKIILAIPQKRYITLLASLFSQGLLSLSPITFFSAEETKGAIQKAMAGNFLGKIGFKL